MRILITGIAGLIGTSLHHALTKNNIEVLGIDHKSTVEKFSGDILDLECLTKKIKQCTGIIHLAAVSRVAHAQNDPTLCWRNNVKGTRNVLNTAITSPIKPWVIYASSREVYGQQSSLPVKEEAGLAPINTYGYSKVCCEMETLQARTQGLRTSIVRFSNVYGGENDHTDRVIPAFVRAALSDHTLRVDGANNVFDFTHIDDVVNGLLKLVDFIESDKQKFIPDIHFASGRGTTLGELADIARRYGNSSSGIKIAPPRNFDVHSFIGSPERALKVLNWRTEVMLEDGIQRMINKFKRAA